MLLFFSDPSFLLFLLLHCNITSRWLVRHTLPAIPCTIFSLCFSFPPLPDFPLLPRPILSSLLPLFTAILSRVWSNILCRSTPSTSLLLPFPLHPVPRVAFLSDHLLPSTLIHFVDTFTCFFSPLMDRNTQSFALINLTWLTTLLARSIYFRIRCRIKRGALCKGWRDIKWMKVNYRPGDDNGGFNVWRSREAPALNCRW